MPTKKAIETAQVLRRKGIIQDYDDAQNDATAIIDSANAELLEAVRPFVEWAEAVLPQFEDDYSMKIAINAGDLRRLAGAYKKWKGE